MWLFSIVLSPLKSSYFFFERGRRYTFLRGRKKLQPPALHHLQLFLGNRYMLHDQVGRFIQKSDRGAWALSPALGTREKFDLLKETNWSLECVQYIKICRSRSIWSPRGQTLDPFLYHFWEKWYPFRIPSTDKWYHFHIPSIENCIPFNCYKYTVFKVLINHKTRAIFSNFS